MRTNRIHHPRVVALGVTIGVLALTSVAASASTTWSLGAADSTQARIAYIHNPRARQRGLWELYVMNADGSGKTRLARNVASGSFHDWSPDGRKIAYMGPRSDRGVNDIYVVSVDASGQRRLARDAQFPAWSPDGRRIAFISERDGNAEIYVMNADGSGKARLARNVASGFHDWSPDGRKHT